VGWRPERPTAAPFQGQITFRGIALHLMSERVALRSCDVPEGSFWRTRHRQVRLRSIEGDFWIVLRASGVM
jgi:hypothetical protein